MASIYFIEPYTGTHISYNKVHNKNDQRWKDKNFPLRIAYEWPTENFVTNEDQELYEMYIDFVDLLYFYEHNEQ